MAAILAVRLSYKEESWSSAAGGRLGPLGIKDSRWRQTEKCGKVGKTEDVELVDVVLGGVPAVDSAVVDGVLGRVEVVHVEDEEKKWVESLSRCWD